MPRRLRPFINDSYYHIFNRGVNKAPIFNNLRDFSRAYMCLKYYKVADPPIRLSKFLKLSREKRSEYWTSSEKLSSLIEIVAYCFMENHFHLLLKQNVESGISKFLGNFQNSYVRFLNTKYKRVGPLFSGQFKSITIEDDEQLLHVSRYIHLNPYTGGIVKTLNELETYKWSSLPEYLNKTSFAICSKDDILSQFGKKLTYKNFVFNQGDYQKELGKIKHLALE